MHGRHLPGAVKYFWITFHRHNFDDRESTACEFIHCHTILICSFSLNHFHYEQYDFETMEDGKTRTLTAASCEAGGLRCCQVGAPSAHRRAEPSRPARCGGEAIHERRKSKQFAESEGRLLIFLTYVLYL